MVRIISRSREREVANEMNRVVDPPLFSTRVSRYSKDIRRTSSTGILQDLILLVFVDIILAPRIKKYNNENGERRGIKGFEIKFKIIFIIYIYI